MTAQTVTATFTTVCHYTFIPDPDFSLTGAGLQMPAYVQGQVLGAPGSPQVLSVQLDSAWTWDVNLRIQGAPPVQVDGFSAAGGGDLFQMLAAQGWSPTYTPPIIGDVIDGGSA
jgi:hypothetical protein